MTRVRILKPHEVRWTHRVERYQQGREYDLDNETAARLVKRGIAEPIGQTKPERATSVPEETPEAGAGAGAKPRATGKPEGGQKRETKPRRRRQVRRSKPRIDGDAGETV